MTGVVLTYSESAELAAEVAAAGAELAAALGTGSAAIELDEVAAGSPPAGATILVKGGRPLEADADAAASAIAEVARAKGFGALLVGDTRFGALVAAKVAARLRVGSLGKGKRLRVEGGAVVLDRDVYGGKFVARVAAKTPCAALVQAGTYKPAGGRPGEVETMSVALGDPRVAVVETRPGERREAGVKSARVVVSAGRGFARKEDLALLDLDRDLRHRVDRAEPPGQRSGLDGEHKARVEARSVYVFSGAQRTSRPLV